ncbi:hypothetical protein XbC2_428 [Xanthomonas phage XbC2]|nr:hypothetical protein XbC2_428 [Xanthomonas phage XbC2]
MSPVLAIICLWAFLFSVYHLGNSIKAAIAWNVKKFWYAVGMFVPFAIVWIDSFLRIFSVTHTGLW